MYFEVIEGKTVHDNYFISLGIRKPRLKNTVLPGLKVGEEYRAMFFLSCTLLYLVGKKSLVVSEWY